MAETINPILRGYKDTAKETGLPVWALRTLVWSGELSVITFGKKHYLDQREVCKVIEKNRERYAAPPDSVSGHERAKRLTEMQEKYGAKARR